MGARAGQPEDAAHLVRAGAFVPKLLSTTSARAIEELGHSLRGALGDLVEPALIAVLEREMVAPTGLGDEVAIPHAAVPGLSRPVVALGLSPAVSTSTRRTGAPPASSSSCCCRRRSSNGRSASLPVSRVPSSTRRRAHDLDDTVFGSR